MARPLDPEKRIAVLESAVHIIARQGLGATTSLIAREAGVSTGSLFTYFPDKQVLLNQLYLHIKTEVAGVLLDGFPQQKSIREKTFHVWQAYVGWACQHPEKRTALQQLTLSHTVTENTRGQAAQMLDAVNLMLSELGRSDICHDVTFISAVMTSLAETTVDFALKQPGKAEAHTCTGFNMFWQMLGL